LSEAGPHLRRMEARDLPSAMEIDALSLPRPWSAAIWRGELSSPYGLYLVIEERGEVFGQIGVRHVLGELHITTIAVRPEYRRRGHARDLIGGALAIALYESLGFRETGRRPRYYGDEDAVLMTLNLDEIHY
jgi:ribosomal-protein-alanine N-acetyltransferase